jgi:lipoate-protein ligase A
VNYIRVVSITLDTNTLKFFKSAARLNASEQMAVDSHLLADAGESGRVSFRTYAMWPPAITIGRHQRWLRVVDEDLCRKSNWDWCRRPTGGGALLHKDEINYAVVAPRGALAPVGEGEFRAVFDTIGRALLTSLIDMGFNPELRIGNRGETAAQHGLCGRSITGNEIALGDLKIVAAAQLITPSGILQHGTIYLKAPSSTDRFWPPVDSQFLSEANAQRWADLGPNFSGRAWDVVAASLEDGFRRHSPIECRPVELTPDDWVAIESKVASWNTSGWNKFR